MDEEWAMGKVSWLAAGAVGYVLGARAGRERYDQMVAQAQRIWGDPRVQEKAAQAAEVVKEKAPEVGGQVADAARGAADKVSHRGAPEAPVTAHHSPN